MGEKLYKLNITITIAEAIVTIVMVLCFGLSAWFFARWWINLFSLIPALLFHAHPLVIESGGEEEDDDKQS